jgi:hypothetical protein
MFKPCPSFTLGKARPIAIPTMLPQPPSEKVIYRNLKQTLVIIFILQEIG